MAERINIQPDSCNGRPVITAICILGYTLSMK